MTKAARNSFVGLAILTIVMPWLTLLFARGALIVPLLWLALLVASIAMLRRSHRLAITGFVALLVTFLSMVIIPSLTRGH
jgi:hypothetical protein